MKGLRLYLPPFAPDTSGAASILYPASGSVVIIDAGGCAGNICGFDEPRWNELNSASAVFSAGLRDMDAIMGRDDKLIEKIELAAKQLNINFVALVSTPVPAIIGTDLKALKRMGERKLGLPMLAIATDGTKLYDNGCRLSYLALFKEFASAIEATIPQSIGVIGASLMDFSSAELSAIRQKLQANGYKHIVFYGYDTGIDIYKQAAAMEENLVIAPAGIAAAKFLKQKFGTPYTIDDPLAATRLNDSALLTALNDKKDATILLIHQQVATKALREKLQARFPKANIHCATWFTYEPDLAASNDVHLKEEDVFQALVADLKPDIIVGDALFKRALPFYANSFIPWHHFAVSGAETCLVPESE